MHKTKENVKSLGTTPDSQGRDAQEAANEERYEAVGGETSSEGVGRAYDESERGASESEKEEASADGPLSGETNDPPSTNPLRKRKVRAKRGVTPPHGRSNHAAAYSTKSI